MKPKKAFIVTVFNIDKTLSFLIHEVVQGVNFLITDCKEKY